MLIEGYFGGGNILGLKVKLNVGYCIEISLR